jgi:hypothetical protein
MTLSFATLIYKGTVAADGPPIPKDAILPAKPKPNAIAQM